MTPAAGFIARMSAIRARRNRRPVSERLRSWSSAPGRQSTIRWTCGGARRRGTVGALLTGVFANKALNGVGDGLLFGNPWQVVVQSTAILPRWSTNGVMSFVLLKLIAVVTAAAASV
jgi:Amt family ammonium transporter